MNTLQKIGVFLFLLVAYNSYSQKSIDTVYCSYQYALKNAKQFQKTTVVIDTNSRQYSGKKSTILCASYKNGHLNGEYQRFSETGLLMQQGQYENGARVGYFDHYSINNHYDSDKLPTSSLQTRITHVGTTGRELCSDSYSDGFLYKTDSLISSLETRYWHKNGNLAKLIKNRKSVGSDTVFVWDTGKNKVKYSINFNTRYFNSIEESLGSYFISLKSIDTVTYNPLGYYGGEKILRDRLLLYSNPFDSTASIDDTYSPMQGQKRSLVDYIDQLYYDYPFEWKSGTYACVEKREGWYRILIEDGGYSHILEKNAFWINENQLKKFFIIEKNTWAEILMKKHAIRFVSAEGNKVYKLPFDSSRILASVPNDIFFEVIEVRGNWMRIKDNVGYDVQCDCFSGDAWVRWKTSNQIYIR